MLANESDSYNYQDWNEFINYNFPDLNDVFEECIKYGGMVSVDPLSDTKDFRQVWYSDWSTDFFSLMIVFSKLELYITIANSLINI